MERRNLPGQAQMPELGRTWNHHQPSDPRINLGTGASTVHADNTVICSLNSVQSSNTSGRIGVLQVPNYHPEVPNHLSNNVASSYDPFICPFAGISARIPSEYVHHGPYYNQIGANDGSMAVNAQIEYQRATNKRKFQAISDVGRGNSSTNYYVGSSSNFPSSSEHAHTKPMLGQQYSHWDPNYFFPSHISNNMLPPVEGSHGTVRRQYSSDIHLRTSAMRPSSNAPHDFHSGANTLGPTGQWSHNPVPLITHTSLASSVAGSGTFNHEVGPVHGAAYVSSGSVGTAQEHSSGFIPHRNSMPSQFLPGPSTRGVVSGHGDLNQGAGYNTNMNPPMGLAVNSEHVGTPGTDLTVPPRFLRPIEIVPHRNERIGRVRNHYGRFPAFTHEDNARASWVSEGVSMMDQLTYIGSRDLYDQHWEMRLDIDSMSYEELLALGDRIGSVSTGLSEDAASKCMRLTTYLTDHIPDDEAELNCAICLEAYREREQVGRLNCNHDFHASCITKWLLIKNACPICKASASTEQ